MTSSPWKLPIDAFLGHVKAHPGKRLFEFVDDRGNPCGRTYTYDEFDRATRAEAQRLTKYSGQCALLVFPPGLEFIVTFFACLRAGVIAVPVYPPRPNAVSKDLAMFITVQRDCGATVALTSSTYLWATKVASFRDALGKWNIRHLGHLSTGKSSQTLVYEWPENLTWHVVDASPPTHVAESPTLDKAVASDVAFLQYTSGSTNAPKGVVLSHGNLAHNLSAIICALKADASTVVVSWLPMYHDMGLIGSHLGTMYCGGSACIMSPFTFVKNPPIWLELASSKKATHMQAPNFAYGLTVRKFSASKGPHTLDLTSIRHIFNAAEPIDPEALDLFVETFAPYGLKRDAVVPGYGLAENTVYVCDGGKQRVIVDRIELEENKRITLLGSSSDKSKARALVGCGNPDRLNKEGFEIHVRIVDPQTCMPLDKDCVGEIWVSSPSKSEAYRNLPEKSQRELHARMVDPLTSEKEEPRGADEDASQQARAAFEADAQRSWLRTGDLGFLHESELFVCGRMKDLIIVRGRNHFPQDIEATVERTQSTILKPGSCAAFAIGDSNERVVVAVEVREGVDHAKLSACLEEVRTNVATEHAIRLAAVVFLGPHTMPKTTSGKITRYRARQMFLAGQFAPLAQWSSSNLEEEDGVAPVEDSREASPSNAATPIDVNEAPAGALFHGEALLDKIRAAAAEHLEIDDPSTLDLDAPLVSLGFDSMALTQFKGTVEHSLRISLDDAVLYDEGTTLRKLQLDVDQRGGHGAAIDHDSALPTSQALPPSEHGTSRARKGAKWKDIFACCCWCLNPPVPKRRPPP